MSQRAAVLVYTRTEGKPALVNTFTDHAPEPIPNAIAALTKQADGYDIDFSFSEDRDLFTDEGLKPFQAIAFVSNSGEILTESGKSAFQRFLDRGGALVGVHSGCCSLFSTECFNQGLGALFDYHPDISTPTFIPLDKNFPATRHLPERWSFKEEVYHFRTDPRDVGAKVIMTVDPDSYKKTGPSSKDPSYSHGDPHPIAWYQTRHAGTSATSSAGRSFFTALGHTDEIWRDPLYLRHVMEGLNWVLDRE